jgi:hypothetical protein
LRIFQSECISSARTMTEQSVFPYALRDNFRRKFLKLALIFILFSLFYFLFVCVWFIYKSLLGKDF